MDWATANSFAISVPPNRTSARRNFPMTAGDFAHCCNWVYRASRPCQNAFRPVVHLDGIARSLYRDRYLDSRFESIGKVQMKKSATSGYFMAAIFVDADADIVDRNPRLIVALHQFAQ
jgi:hypothetical protein